MGVSAMLTSAYGSWDQWAERIELGALVAVGVDNETVAFDHPWKKVHRDHVLTSYKGSLVTHEDVARAIAERQYA